MDWNKLEYIKKRFQYYNGQIFNKTTKDWNENGLLGERAQWFEYDEVQNTWKMIQKPQAHTERKRDFWRDNPRIAFKPLSLFSLNELYIYLQNQVKMSKNCKNRDIYD